ncbi:MAG: hypothetical protein P1V97_27405, partial [Planctomycetota bacterium]|nr:hypothetical protein [Planctomycetota bacterium]
RSGELSSNSREATVPIDFTLAESRLRRVIVKISTNPLVESLDGIENLIREPHGCFEQTSSTTYPNALILSYLKT